jgi:hypothetical protein
VRSQEVWDDEVVCGGRRKGREGGVCGVAIQRTPTLPKKIYAYINDVIIQKKPPVAKIAITYRQISKPAASRSTSMYGVVVTWHILLRRNIFCLGQDCRSHISCGYR